MGASSYFLGTSPCRVGASPCCVGAASCVILFSGCIALLCGCIALLCGCIVLLCGCIILLCGWVHRPAEWVHCPSFAVLVQPGPLKGGVGTSAPSGTKLTISNPDRQQHDTTRHDRQPDPDAETPSPARDKDWDRFPLTTELPRQTPLPPPSTPGLRHRINTCTNRHSFYF